MLELPGVHSQTSNLVALALRGTGAALKVLIEVELIGAWLGLGAQLARVAAY